MIPRGLTSLASIGIESHAIRINVVFAARIQRETDSARS